MIERHCHFNRNVNKNSLCCVRSSAGISRLACWRNNHDDYTTKCIWQSLYFIGVVLDLFLKHLLYSRCTRTPVLPQHSDGVSLFFCIVSSLPVCHSMFCTVSSLCWGSLSWYTAVRALSGCLGTNRKLKWCQQVQKGSTGQRKLGTQ